MNKKRFLPLITAVICFCFLLQSCSIAEFFKPEMLEEEDGGVTGEDAPKPDYTSVFTLARYSDEPLGPYTSQNRANHDILSLCYDPLIYYNSQYEPVPVICESYISGDGFVILYLRQDIVFSDGTKLTADDCYYSFAKAQKAESVYASRFTQIRRFEAISDYEFRVEFFYDNIYNINLLDIPIIKAGSDSTSAYPTGSGRYIISKDGNSLCLIKNTGYFDYSEEGTSFIDIIDISNTESMLYNINYGKIHAVYADLTDGNSAYRGNVELVSYTTNNLVYAVVNKAREYLSSPDFSKALMYAVDRLAMIEDVCGGNASSVWYPFNPSWSVVSEASLNPDIYDTAAAHELFVSAGYTLSGTERIYNGKDIAITVTVNQENINRVKTAEELASCLTDMGFSVQIIRLKWQEYLTAAENGDYDILIAETKLYPNMDFRTVIVDYTAFDSKYIPNEALPDLDAAAELFYSGEGSLTDLLSVLREAVPVIPLYYTESALAVSRSVTGLFAPSDSRLFNNMENWAM